MDEIILPNFLCLGAPKSATTSLFEILKQHPEIGLSSFKETHFFDTDINWNKGKKWYSDSYFSNLTTKKRIGEFTPSYLCKEICAQRIKDTLEDKVKFVVILRNPIDRAFSHYLHTSRDEYEKLSFIESLSKETERLENFVKQKDDLSYARFCYKDSSMYSSHLKNYFNIFNKEQFCIILFNDFVKNRSSTINKILRFLDLSTEFKMNIDLKINPASEARSVNLKKIMTKKSIIRTLLKYLIPSLSLRQKIKNKIHERNNRATVKPILTTEERLFCYNNYFKNDIINLEELLNIDLKDWKE
jgi:hypothetical protein